MTPAPIRLVESRGCRGLVDMRARTLGICICCDLLGRGGEQIEPRAARDACGSMDCPDRRSTGAVHVEVDGDRVTVEG